MCTLSWLLHDSGYDVFFNRDEQRSRAKAIPPALIEERNAIMPVDPQGLGTWIAVSLSGLSLCLLNNYQCQSVTEKNKIYTSRGLLIPQLIQLQQAEEVYTQLKQLDLNNYAAFFLCAFPKQLNKQNACVYIYQWDGGQLSKALVEQPFISSSVLLQSAKESRKNIFKEIITAKPDVQQHLAYHASHLTEKGALSVCMHREDARTQSLSHISVDKNISFHYHDGSPCENNGWTSIEESIQQKIFS